MIVIDRVLTKRIEAWIIKGRATGSSSINHRKPKGVAMNAASEIDGLILPPITITQDTLDLIAKAAAVSRKIEEDKLRWAKRARERHGIKVEKDGRQCPFEAMLRGQ